MIANFRNYKMIMSKILLAEEQEKYKILNVKNIWMYTAREEKMREVKDRSRNSFTKDKRRMIQGQH